MGKLLNRKEGVTQGKHLEMIAQRIRIIPIIRRNLRDIHLELVQHWYSDNSEYRDKYGRIKSHLEDLMQWGPDCGYFMDTTKIILVIPETNLPHMNELFRKVGLKVVTGSRYMGALLRDTEVQKY